MKVIPYRIKLIEPLLATQIAGDPNSAVSHPYIPGSMVRGAIVRAYLRGSGVTTLDAGDEEARRLFFDGRTRYLNAYPTTSPSSRMLPTPRSWFTVKGEEDPIYDFAGAVRWTVDGQNQQFTAVADETRPFCWADGGQVYFKAPKRRVTVHTQRDRLRGRAHEKIGEVFQYDALEAGELFAGFVLVDGDEDAERISALLGEATTLGGSSNSGYGLVKTEVETPIDLKLKSWREVKGAAEAIPQGGSLVITLLSDALVRSQQTGQYGLDIREALEEALQVQLQMAPHPDDLDPEEEQRGASRPRVVGGFNRTWGLPLPQAQAISAGSVFVYTALQPIDAKKIVQAEWRGIGERGAEGYGRIAFNWQTDSLLQLTKAPVMSVPSSPPALDETGRKVGTAMLKRLLDTELEIALRKRMNSLNLRSAPSNAQLSRLRVIAREAIPAGDIERLQSYVKSLESRRSTAEQFDRARITIGRAEQEPAAGKRLSRWLTDLLDNPVLIWQELGVSNLERSLGTTLRVSVSNDDDAARKYAIRLIDAVLAKAARQKREQEDEEK